MAPKRTKAKASGFSCIDTPIYCEARGAALRFKVRVHPLNPLTKTVDRADEAESRLGPRHSAGASPPEAVAPRWCSGHRSSPTDTVRPPAPSQGSGRTADVPQAPERVTVDAILTWYEKHGIPFLSTSGSRTTETSRVKKPRAMLGAWTLEDLTEAELERWIQRRLRGEGGGARSDWRNERYEATRVLTKDQRWRMRAAIARGEDIAAKGLLPAVNPIDVTEPKNRS